MSLVCKVCSDSSAYIRNEARLKGIKKRMINVDNYSDDVASIHLVANIKNIKTKIALDCPPASAGTGHFWQQNITPYGRLLIT